MSIFVPPTVTKELNSITTTMAATIKMECAATGYPAPDIVWYRNGERIVSNSVTVVDGGLLRIHSVDPKDEGIYQCFAGNVVGQVFSTAYLTVRTSDVHVKLPKLYGIKCYPIDYTSILVTFRATEPVDMITYYLKGEQPHSWDAVPPIRTSQRFIIAGKMDPLRTYTLHLRGLMEPPMEAHQKKKSQQQESMLIMSRLSKGVQCQTQGMEVMSTAFPDHIFLWWPHHQQHRKSNYSTVVDYYLVQLWNNETLDNPSLFATEVIGTTATLDEYKTWDEIEKMLVKVPVQAKFINSTYAMGTPESFVGMPQKESVAVAPGETRKKSLMRRQMTRTHFNVTEIRLAGNVTGLLIPNTKRVIARVIGVKEGEVVVDQDLQYVQWKTVRRRGRMVLLRDE